MFNYDAYDETEAAEDSGVLNAQERKWGRRHTLSWNDLNDNVKVFPQHADQADDEIFRHLGYTPPKLISLRHEPFIRALIEDKLQGRLTPEAFRDAVTVQVRHIRNDDMQRGGWATPYTEADHYRYETHLVQFKERARARLLKGLGFEPLLEYSLDAELILRDQFLLDWFSEEHNTYTAYDCRAYTILFYRKALRESGRKVANEIDLMGVFS